MADPRTRVVTISFGQPFPTGEECPHCGFDSVIALLYVIGSSPNFRWMCDRGCGNLWDNHAR